MARMNNPFSSFTKQERFLAYVVITGLVAAVVGFVAYAAILLHLRIQESNKAARQNSAATPPVNYGSDLVNPPDVWSTQAGGSTNTAATAPGIQNPQTNSN